MDLKYKRFIPTKAKKAKNCHLCMVPWVEGTDIFIMKDISKEKDFELICFLCGSALSQTKETNLIEIEQELLYIQESVSKLLSKVQSMNRGGGLTLLLIKQGAICL